MDHLGYDVVTLGEREFNFGQRFLLDCFKKTKMELVCANLYDTQTKKPFVKPYVIRRAGPVRVAFFGLIGKDLKIRTLESEHALEVRDPFEVAKTLVPELRKRADVVVLLSHIGLTEGQRLTTEVPGIDVMVFGHMPGMVKEIAKNTNGVIVARGGERGQTIPSIHLSVQDGKIASFDGEAVTLDDKVPADDAMNLAVDSFNDAINRRFSNAAQASAAAAERATAAAVAGDQYLGEKNCRRCHEKEYQLYSKQDHAKAFATLEKEQRESTPECIGCHVVGYGQPGGFISKQATPDLVNVQCESCHGVGTRHDKMTSGGATVGPEVCQTCHTKEQAPNFQYDQALEKIVHWE
jgi:cytochrome c554/c'-like protein